MAEMLWLICRVIKSIQHKFSWLQLHPVMPWRLLDSLSSVATDNTASLTMSLACQHLQDLDRLIFPGYQGDKSLPMSVIALS